MREVTILIENLTGCDLELSRVVSQDGTPRNPPPEVLSRACKLSWLGRTKEGQRTGCAMAIEFRSKGSGYADTRPSRKSFMLAVQLPRPSQGVVSWLGALSSPGGDVPKFAARLQDLAPGQSPGDVRQLLEQAPPLQSHGSAAGCEWLAVRREAEFVDVRLRLLPEDTAVPEQRSEELPPELTQKDEAELKRLRGYREVLATLRRQSEELEALSGEESMDLSRIASLPEKVKVDLALAFLSTLLGRRHQSLLRLAERLDVEPGDDSPTSLDTGSPEVKLREALDSHVSTAFAGMVRLLGFGDAKREAKVTELASTYLKAPKSRWPDLAELCSSVRLALAGQSAEEASTTVGWAADRCWPVGGEDAVARLGARLPFFGRVLVPSAEDAARKLSEGSLWCPEDACLTYIDKSPDEVLYREGCREKVLKHLSASSEEELKGSGELPPDPKVFSKGSKALPRSWLLARELLAMMLGAGAGTFDARSRAAMLEMFGHFGIPEQVIAGWESEIGGALFEALEASSILEAQKAARGSWRNTKVAMAAAGGGLVLAITGGLAAPIVAPALATGAAAVGAQAAAVGAAVGLTQAGVLVGGAISGLGVGLGSILASLGTAGAVALFGATGAGLTGWKMSKRWGDLEEFEFQPLETSFRTIQETVDLDDAEATAALDQATTDGTLREDVAVPITGGGLHALRKGSELTRRQTLPNSGSREGQLGAASPGGSTTVRYHFQHKVDQVQRSVHLALFVSGWIQDRADFRKPWMDAAKVFFPKSGHLALHWETQELLDVSGVFGQMVAQEVASSTASFWLKSSAVSTVAAAGVAGSIAAMTVAWPVWIVSSMANLDNAWLVGVERARIGGKCLAQVLADRQTVGQRPVTLIGHSMGARLLVYCLCELYHMGEFHAVDDVVLLGAPVTTEARKWQKVRAVASGRVVNGYLGKDWVLAFLYRYLEWGLSVAGLSQVQVPGVENVNLDGLGIQGHHDYPNHIADILAKLRVGERHPEVLSQANKPAGAAGAGFL